MQCRNTETEAAYRLGLPGNTSAATLTCLYLCPLASMKPSCGKTLNYFRGAGAQKCKVPGHTPSTVGAGFGFINS